MDCRVKPGNDIDRLQPEHIQHRRLTLIAQFVGAGNHKMVGHVAGQTMLMVIASALVLGIAGFFLAPALLRLMGVAPEVHDGALGFMRVSFVGLVFNFSFFVFNAIAMAMPA